MKIIQFSVPYEIFTQLQLKLEKLPSYVLIFLAPAEIFSLQMYVNACVFMDAGVYLDAHVYVDTRV